MTGKYDNNFKQAIEQEYQKIANESSDEMDEIMNSPVDFEEVEPFLKKLKIGKATGIDSVSNEHLKYGGPKLKEHLIHLMNGIFHVEKLPKVLKRGVLITIHKGVIKYLDDRKNHRGITLLNSVYKLLEMIMLQRINAWANCKGIKFPSDQQGAYQKQLCSVMTAFNMQETIAYYLERNSKVHLCLLDTATAFDTVWIKGLMVKLYRFGIKGKLWRIINDCYTDMETAILFQGQMSDWISVERSVRQGGVMSPWLYMLYINDLPEKLKTCQQIGKIGDIICCSPLQADDVSLISPTVNGLQSMIDVVEQYAFKWRYELNSTKSRVMVYGGRKKQLESSVKSTWRLNGNIIQATNQEKHVGIMLDSSLKSHKRTKAACRKGRNTLMSLIGIGVKGDGLNPVVSSHLLKTIVLPRTLYGAELWNNMSNEECVILERTLCFCCKFSQDLSQRCRSDMCTAMLGLYQMKAHIDLRKLIFLGRIAWLPDGNLTKRIFKTRTMQYLVNRSLEISSSAQLGYVPDIVNIISKYHLEEYWEEYVRTGFTEFPIYTKWKDLIKKAITEVTQLDWEQRVTNDPDFLYFRQVHNIISKPIQIWKFAQENPKLLQKCRTVARFLTRTPMCFLDIQLCCYCGKFYRDIYVHLALECNKCHDDREYMWSEITDKLPVEFSVYLNNLSDDELYCHMLGQQIDNCTREDANQFLTLSIEYLNKINIFIY